VGAAKAARVVTTASARLVLTTFQFVLAAIRDQRGGLVRDSSLSVLPVVPSLLLHDKSKQTALLFFD
jgi:hypothetical protein